MVVRIGI